MRKKISFRLLIVLVVFIMASGTSVAYADEYLGEITGEQENTIRESFTELGIELEQQEQLILKLEKGELLDCQNPIYANMEPSYRRMIDDCQLEIRYEFPDGSVRVERVFFLAQRIENDLERVQAYVTDGSWYSGSGHMGVHDAKVYATDGICELYFWADFECRQAGNGRISRVYLPGGTSNLGTMSDFSVSIVREEGEEYGQTRIPAQAVYSAKYRSFASGVTVTYYTTLNVYSNSYNVEIEIPG